MQYAKKYKWLDNVKLIFFGPVENLIAKGDYEIQRHIEMTKELEIEGVACRKIAEDKGYLKKLNLILKTEYVGEVITNLLKDGYVPLVF